MLSVFLSHNHNDKPFARRLAERLSAHGVRVWLDEAEMHVGDSLFSKIESAIRECTYLGVILSPSSVSSEWVQREVNMALGEEIHGRRVKVLPLLHEPCEIPGFLTDKVYADFSVDFESGFSVLQRRLDSDLHEESYKKSRAYEMLQSGYQDWTAFSKQDGRLLDQPTVHLVIQYVKQTSLSLDLLEYLLSSIAGSGVSDLGPDEIEQLRLWIGSGSLTLMDRLLEHRNPRVRIGALAFFGLLGECIVGNRVLEAIDREHDQEVRRTALHTSTQLGVSLPENVATELLTSDSDWVVQSHALRALHDKQGCLLISDGTEFAAQLGDAAANSGFHVVSLPTSFVSFELERVPEDLLHVYSLVMMVRGEHFAQSGNDGFYKRLRCFVASGGLLFATSWVSWEMKYRSEFAEVLPFRHIRDSFNEDVHVTCRPTDEGIAQNLPAESFSVLTSFELLERREASTVLLEAIDSMPVLGYRSFGSGMSYYLNTCQHSCLRHMESPLTTSPQLSDVVGTLLMEIHNEAVARKGRANLNT